MKCTAFDRRSMVQRAVLRRALRAFMCLDSARCINAWESDSGHMIEALRGSFAPPLPDHQSPQQQSPGRVPRYAMIASGAFTDRAVAKHRYTGKPDCGDKKASAAPPRVDSPESPQGTGCMMIRKLLPFTRLLVSKSVFKIVCSVLST